MLNPLSTRKPATLRQTEARDMLAKLLAREDITVIHDPKAETASFDGASRTLRMPVWVDMSDALSDMLVAHEVGHALHTPAGVQPVVDAMKRVDPSGNPITKIYLNIVEDARIEREIKAEFPGVKRAFATGYRELLNSGFFGLNETPMESRSLADRINIHAKIGNLVAVPFTPYERTLLDRVLNAKDWNEVVELSRILWKYDGEKGNYKPQSMQMPEPGDEDGDGDGDADGMDSMPGQDGGSNESGEEDGTESPTGKDGKGKISPSRSDEDGESDEASSETMSNDAAEFSPPSAPMSAERLQRGLDSMRDASAGARVHGVLPVPNLNAIIINQDLIRDRVMQWEDSLRNANITQGIRVLEEAHDHMVRDMDKQVTTMVREFERRRAAQVSRRTASSPRGVLNVNRIHAYKFSEDIFKHAQIVKDGQSHGMVMFVDWSSSMGPIIGDTVNQVISLASFCRKVRIPFDVYAFSSVDPNDIRQNGPREKCWSANEGEVNVHGFSLLHLISSSLNRRDFDRATRNMLILSHINGSNSYVAAADAKHVPGSRRWADSDPTGALCKLRLSSTPLNSAIVAAHDIMTRFREAHRLQIVSAIFLTDGGATDSIVSGVHSAASFGSAAGLSVANENNGFSYGSQVWFRHRDARKYRRGNDYNNNRFTNELLDSLRDHAKCRVLGINIIHSSWTRIQTRAPYEVSIYFRDDATRTAALAKAAEDNVLVVDRSNPNCGYDELYVLSGSTMAIGNDNLLDDLDSNASLTKIRNTFMKQSTTVKTSRIFLNRFIPMISESL